jgi:hypothetical protein
MGCGRFAIFVGISGHGVDFDFFVNSTKSERVPEDIAEIPRGTANSSRLEPR